MPGEVPTPLTTPTSGLTPREDRRLADLLRKWNGGGISTPVFTALARMIPQSIVEVVFLRTRNDVLETLLIPRPEDDIVWPGMLHTPGVALRASDYTRPDGTPLNGAFERVQREIGGLRFARHPIFVGILERMVQRGPDVARVFRAELEPDSILKPGHKWHPVDGIENNPKFIMDQLGHVQMAAAHYRAALRARES